MKFLSSRLYWTIGHAGVRIKKFEYETDTWYRPLLCSEKFDSDLQTKYSFSTDVFLRIIYILDQWSTMQQYKFLPFSSRLG